MSELIQETQADGRLCPVCPDELGRDTWVEPEIDGDHRFYDCPNCGYNFGWERINPQAGQDGTCAIGVPEQIRRAASAPMENAMRQDGPQPIAGAKLGIRRAE